MMNNEETDKNECFQQFHIKHHHRNVFATVLFGFTNLALLICSIYKVNSNVPIILSVILNGIAQYVKTNSSMDKHIENEKSLSINFTYNIKF